jgi:hypothetical protein
MRVLVPVVYNLRLCLLNLMLLLASVAQGWGQVDMKRDGLKAAARAAAETYVKDYASQSDKGNLRDKAAQKMLENPTIYKSPDQAEPRIRKIIDGIFKANIEQKIRLAYANLRLEGKGIPYEEYRKDVEQVDGRTIIDTINQFSAGQSGQIFSAARREAVDAQWQNVKDLGYPSIQDVDRADRAGFETAQQIELKQAAIARIARKLPDMFDEVAGRSHDLAETVLRDIEAQRSTQVALVQSPLPVGLVTSGQMMAYLRATAEAAIAQQRKEAKNGRIIYDLLPSIEQRMRDRTVTEEANRLQNSMATITVPIDIGALQAAIAADPARHRERAASESIFLQENFAAAVREATQATLRRAADAPDLAVFSARLASVLKNPGGIRHALEQRIAALLQKPLDTARAAVTKEQLIWIAPALADRSWVPSEAVLTVYVKQETGLSDYDKIIDLEGVVKGGTPMARESRLTETENLAADAARALLEQGKRAWNEQGRIVEVEGDRAKNRITAEQPRREEEWYFQEYLKRSMDAWKASRMAAVWPTDQDAPLDKATEPYPVVPGASRYRL